MDKYKILRVLLGSDTSYLSGEEVLDYPSTQVLLENQSTPGIVIIDGLNSQDPENVTSAFDALVELRESAAFCYSPIYFSSSMGEIDPAVDGITTDMRDKLSEATAILERGKRIRSDKLIDNSSLRLLSYMYTRGETYQLKPLCVPFSQWVYVYPVAALLLSSDGISTRFMKAEDVCGLGCMRTFKFDKDMISSVILINFLEENGYIAKTDLIDRIRMCPKCKTGHLNYIDLCPNCGSIDFDKKTMLHCFTCGYVAPESDFTRNMTLVCPSCASVLRHLGSDYDHPLESYECNNCSSRFIDPNVKADCFFCRTRTEPDNLIVNNVFGYILTEKGSTAVKTGTMYTEIRLFDGMNNVVLTYFCRTLDWLSELRKRYAEEAFSLLGIRISGVGEVEEALGQELFNEFMTTLTSRIREMVRTVDVTTSTGPDTFWILLPRTKAENCDAIAKRVMALSELVTLPLAPKISISAKCFVLPYGLSGEATEKQLRLYSESL